MEALEAARRRMQEELDSRAAQYREKMRQVSEGERVSEGKGEGEQAHLPACVS